MHKKFFYLFFLMCLLSFRGLAQDPHFSQFFMAPQFINPALMGNFEGDWRMMGNFRHQWGFANTPFTTGVFAGEMKFSGKDENQFEDENKNILAAGAAMMFDQSMNGAFKSNYAVANIAYHKQLDLSSSLGIGFHAMYANRRIDYSSLTFGEQFTSIRGFDASALNGETTLSNAKPYFSLGTGIMYNFRSTYLNIGVGGSVFHINNPKQTFLGDETQAIPMRYVGHFNAEYEISPSLFLSVNGIYQYQSRPSYFAIGGALGMDISGGDGSSTLYTGAWFREGDSFYPYVGLAVGRMQFGFTYDITHSKQIQGPAWPRSFEMSFVIRDVNPDPETRSIRCPHK